MALALSGLLVVLHVKVYLMNLPCSLLPALPGHASAC